MRSRFAFAAGAVIAASVPALLGAQYGPSALQAAGDMNGCVSGGNWQQTPATQSITSCPANATDGVSGSSYSMATFTTLRASASLAGNGGNGPASNFPNANGRAYTHETFTFTGALPASARMYFAIDGTESGGVPSAGLQAESEIQFITSWNSGGNVTGGTYGYGNVYAAAGGHTVNFTTANWIGGGAGSVLYPITAAVNQFDIYMFAGVGLYQYAAGSVPSALFATSDFAATGKIVGLQFFDANGNDVTTSTAFTDASGTMYALGAPTVTTAPEPATSMSVAAGLLAVAAMQFGLYRRGVRKAK